MYCKCIGKIGSRYACVFSKLKSFKALLCCAEAQSKCITDRFSIQEKTWVVVAPKSFLPQISPCYSLMRQQEALSLLQVCNTMPEKQKTHVLNSNANKKPSFSFSIIVCVTLDFRYKVKCMNLGNFLVGIWDIFSPDHPGTYIYIFMLSSLFFK